MGADASQANRSPTPGSWQAGRNDAPALEDLSDSRVVHMSTMDPAKVVIRKAPSPRQWLSEPLSVSVGRHDPYSSPQQVQANMAAATAERILARGASGWCL